MATLRRSVSLFLYVLYLRSFSFDRCRSYCLYSLFFLLTDLSKLFVSQGFLKEFRALPLIVLKGKHVSNKPVYLSIKTLQAVLECLALLASSEKSQFVFSSSCLNSLTLFSLVSRIVKLLLSLCK